uniref:DNA damage-regulated autophagy modulator protein 1-like n=1 Tax=Dermatophagoides pteronyssinus TaxID=6956 RepID=A0A6P6XS02_DERPT|nr:DNA damage-regulated autophagy modulator protein 1-like [Dermatophagoides pteronyssinus]
MNQTESYLIIVEDVDNGSSTLSSAPANLNFLQNIKQITPYKQKFYHIFQQYLWIFPLIIGFLFPVFCVILYVDKLVSNDLHPILPLISDLGSKPPVAGYVAQIFDTIAILNLLTVYARYEQVKFYIEKYFQNSSIDICRRLKQNNKYFTISGCGFSLGVITLGNFRNTEQPMEHGIGFIIMSCILGYIFFTTKICDDLYSFKRIESQPSTIRCCGWIILISLIMSALFLIIAVSQLDSIYHWFDNNQRLNWKPNHPGYIWFTLGTFSEWFFVNWCSIYFFSISHRIHIFNRCHRIK